MFDGAIITKNGNRVHCYHSILERSGTKRDFTRSNFRTRVVCDVVCDLVGRAVLGAPRAEGRSIVAGRRGRRPLPAFRSTVPFESCWPFGSGMPREEEISRGATSVPGGSFAMSSVIWRTVMSSARRAHGDVPLSRAAEDVGPYQRSGLQCRSRVVGRSVRECPGRKRFHAEQLPYPAGRLRCRL